MAGSRQVEDRDSLQRSLDRAMRVVNEALRPAQRLEITLGDEFQAAFDDLGSAARASLLLRLHLLKDGGVESRYGIGFGTVAVYEGERAPFSQDGPRDRRRPQLGRIRLQLIPIPQISA